MKSTKIKISQPSYWDALLKWSNQFENIAIFYPQQIEQYPFGAFPKCIAVGNKKLKLNPPYFQSLKSHLKENPTQKLFGYLGYDLKNELEKLESKNASVISWEPMNFFVPDCIISCEENQLSIQSADLKYFLNQIEKVLTESKREHEVKSNIKSLKSWTSKSEYINTVKKLRNHIEEGDIYEINYCINFSAVADQLNPIKVFEQLCENSPAPFASFLKMDNKYIISASPERFIKLKDNKIISQPIKGTASRGKTEAEDKENKKQLSESEKERAENMMIVDLVRNDLAKSSRSGSVKVEEIFGIYSFQQVHQMISTISAHKRKETHPIDVIKNAFPMGSMTGAPKIRAMKLIERYENSKRNVFSGSIGYFNGENEFDFNVLIRSIYFDKESKNLNYQVGSAITYDSDAEAEYEECLLKAKAIEKTLGFI
ncbi:para-aminobenzoate synthase [Marivirga tractuosa]|uniref:Chorismate binding protein n=1 Tax=Marivirga tractuosa (strain ATCC 23168 / DSM 4126 / NBRC 15989 / NCIMB 1408 / VKM B-1430 / H-43) TaxID=643867 RepID=E4TS07_MARTH|nr:aminodeoxychorismate synthase component I [Marivirga tractuosa]ADR20758.1 Chorismate binding protein [Marivirga tractuosa DSM 4126]BDD14791.1 para-aminobenzoate synthase [Marivirga tractuosa]